ncbi:hypothetical protein TUM19329_04780 [Legionella antarctica]|uniref:Uncharacterized protein n=1 Tax=Legionella antarctica TaxID=2708020 RepID=A0A6F8T1R7_9GAMM|nr:hypothetical protein [Legionella antarctica]BCA94117.1 hypothetical protein TUM19329_04780 [Legionella antarctica]
MSRSGDDSASNRYGFLKPAGQSTLNHPGVNSEFAHQIHDRVKSLVNSIVTVQKSGTRYDATEKSDSMKAQLEILKSESTDPKQEAREVLKECLLKIEEVNNTNHKLTL